MAIKADWRGMMTNQSIPPLIDFFKHIKDPRVERNKAYPLLGHCYHPAGRHGLCRKLGRHRKIRESHGMPDNLHTNTGYTDFPLPGMVLLPALSAAVFPRFPLPVSAVHRNTDSATIHER
jgi:hypothetical protein